MVVCLQGFQAGLLAPETGTQARSELFLAQEEAESNAIRKGLSNQNQQGVIEDTRQGKVTELSWQKHPKAELFGIQHSEVEWGSSRAPKRNKTQRNLFNGREEDSFPAPWRQCPACSVALLCSTSRGAKQL